MSRNSLWKIKRELQRLSRDSKEMAAELVRKIYFRRYYDLVTSKNIRRTEGAVPFGNEVAIYLIFPSAGLLPSHRHMLVQLCNAGISPLVVSNIPLNDTDRGQLVELSAAVMERPNVGYDFGGYRDGILEVAKYLHNLDRVWLLNDSAWLMPHQPSWFEQARATGKDFIGATSSFSILRRSLFGKKRLNVSEYRSIKWSHEPSNSNFHYASYALCIGSAILKDHNFLKYWGKLDIRDDKKHTVRRGEIGLTQWVLKHGYTHGATYEIDQLDKELDQQSAAELDRIARELVIFKGTKLAAIKSKVLATDPNDDDGRADRKGLILMAVARQGSAYALATFILRKHEFQFLKKSLLWLSSDGPDNVIKYVDTLTCQEGVHIADEARILCAGRAILYTAN